MVVGGPCFRPPAGARAAPGPAPRVDGGGARRAGWRGRAGGGAGALRGWGSGGDEDRGGASCGLPPARGGGRGGGGVGAGGRAARGCGGTRAEPGPGRPRPDALRHLAAMGGAAGLRGGGAGAL
ncbi:hypothetical protein CCS92_33500, partial [Methylobacterium radiotolerans]